MSGSIGKVLLGATATLLTGPAGLGLWGAGAGAAAGAAGVAGAAGAAGAAAGGLTATQAALAGGLGAGILGSMSQPNMPGPTSATVMPTPDGQAIQQAQRRSISAQMARRGRASTILTGNQSPGETLGG
jgi:hypothetical protein